MSYPEVKIGELTNPINGKTFKSSEWSKQGMPIIRIQNLKNKNAEFNYFNGLIEDKYQVKTGDLLFAWSGTPGTSFGAFIWDGPEGVLNQHIFRIPLDEKKIDKDYLFYALNNRVAGFIEQAQGGVGLAHITKAKFVSSTVPLPDIHIQKKIVNKLNDLFSGIDAGSNVLQAIKLNLELYKQSILNSAVRGDLVSQDPNDEPASVLLEKIKAEKDALINAGKLKKEKPLPPIDQDEVPFELPMGWVWCRLKDIADVKGGLAKDSKKKYLNSKSLPYLRVANVQRGYLNLDEIKYIDVPEDKVETLLLKKGDILFNEGGDRDKLGRGWIWEEQIAQCIHQNHVFRARLYSREILPEFVSHYGNTFGKDYFLAGGKQTTNLASVSLSVLSMLPVPIPPIAEQHKIIEILKAYISEHDFLHKKLKVIENEIDILKKSILKSAFEGKLI